MVSYQGLWRPTLFNRLLAAAVAVTLISADAVAQCAKDTREVGIGAATARFASYFCKATPQSPQVKVEFVRLSEAAAAGVLTGQLWPEVSEVFGRARLIDNAVSAEARDLFKRFGKTQDHEDAYYVQALTPKVGKSTDKISAGSGIKQLTYLTYPDTEGLTMQPIVAAGGGRRDQDRNGVA